jgi:hypothetical protein
MNLLSKEIEELLSEPLILFQKTYDEIIDFLSSTKESIKINDNFTQVLLPIYHTFFIDNIPAIGILMKNRYFLSVSKISRSILEITAYIKHLYQDTEREEKSKNIIEFSGGIIKENGSINYDWFALITKNSIRDVLISQHLDLSNLLDFNFKTNTGEEIRLSMYDALSKISHYNPKMLKEIITVNENNFQEYNLNIINICLWNIFAIIHAIVNMALVFYEHCHPQETYSQSLLSILSDFSPNFKSCLKKFKAASA